MVEKKYMKVGVAALAALAIVIGVAVGVTQSQKRNASASQAYGYANMGGVDEECEEVAPTYSKAAKSSGGGGKSGKSGSKGGKSSSMSYGEEEEEAANMPYRRRLVVPGTEEYAAGVEAGKRAQLRTEQQQRSEFCAWGV